MRRQKTLAQVVTFLIATILNPGTVFAQGASPSELEEFGTLVVGSWESDDQRHVISWGVGRKAVGTVSYSHDGEVWTPVSEGMWWFDDQAGVIRGVVVAVDMPVERFEYITRVEGSTVRHDLRAFGEMRGQFTEVWNVDDEGYDWYLEAVGPGDERSRLMGGRFRRMRRPD